MAAKKIYQQCRPKCPHFRIFQRAAVAGCCHACSCKQRLVCCQSGLLLLLKAQILLVFHNVQRLCVCVCYCLPGCGCCKSTVNRLFWQVLSYGQTVKGKCRKCGYCGYTHTHNTHIHTKALSIFALNFFFLIWLVSLEQNIAQMFLSWAPDLRGGECEECSDSCLHNDVKLAMI